MQDEKETSGVPADIQRRWLDGEVLSESRWGMTDYWREAPNCILGLECCFNPSCPFDGAEMGFYVSKVHKFKINDGDHDSHAIDMEFTCPECGYWTPFGVAISKEHYERIKNDPAFDWGGDNPL